ncbi:MAG: TIGR01777 family oxidoreductase [Planctomycetota bacterium]|jgi:uncharacterized protein (TIGR01777 family)
MSKQILITGATGFIGRAVCTELVKGGYQIAALTRQPNKARDLLTGEIKVVQWDAISSSGWGTFADGALAIINLAGESIGTGRWTRKKKQQIMESRLNAGQAILSAVENTRIKPQVIIQASGVGYYGDRGDEILSESASEGTGFLADVARQWEQSIQVVASMGVRLAVIRIAPVLGAEGGLMSRVLPVFRCFLGGRLGSGKQWFPWIHIDDVVGAIRFLIENDDSKGVFNLTSPSPIRSGEFYTLLGRVMHRPTILHIPAFLLKLILGEMGTELLLSGQRVLPERLLQAGYNFKYFDAKSALENIVGNER